MRSAGDVFVDRRHAGVVVVVVVLAGAEPGWQGGVGSGAHPGWAGGWAVGLAGWGWTVGLGGGAGRWGWAGGAGRPGAAADGTAGASMGGQGRGKGAWGG
jgi:hypothetical protein